MSERAYAQTDRRRSFIAFYAWAVPTRQVIDAIVRLASGRKLLEVCAGNGLWSRLTAGAGADVIATDAAPPRDVYMPVYAEKAEAAVRAHPECEALMLCWPPFRNDCAYRALRAFTGNLLIFAGDPRFTADSQFHSLLLDEWRLEESIPIPAWPGLEDRVFLYHRSTQAAAATRVGEAS
jgi:hypothetical protein